MACRSTVGEDVLLATVCQWYQEGEAECQLALPHLSLKVWRLSTMPCSHWLGGVPTSPATTASCSFFPAGWMEVQLLEAIIQSQHGDQSTTYFCWEGNERLGTCSAVPVTLSGILGWVGYYLRRWQSSMALGWRGKELVSPLSPSDTAGEREYFHCAGCQSGVSMVIRVFCSVSPPFSWYFILGKTSCSCNMFCLLMVPDSRLLLCPLWNIRETIMKLEELITESFMESGGP